MPAKVLRIHKWQLDTFPTNLAKNHQNLCRVYGEKSPTVRCFVPATTKRTVAYSTCEATLGNGLYAMACGHISVGDAYRLLATGESFDLHRFSIERTWYEIYLDNILVAWADPEDSKPVLPEGWTGKDLTLLPDYASLVPMTWQL